ncbi:Homeobox HD1 [Gossypium australe]|uniref:Homeobox HD1 n=1 Tax=Gossypium australe TaxID=47621 RepID=A0A5B6UXW9_9ROSI|nr:Homeobox HD1 [Gossypium australe]
MMKSLLSFPIIPDFSMSNSLLSSLNLSASIFRSSLPLYGSPPSKRMVINCHNLLCINKNETGLLTIKLLTR